MHELSKKANGEYRMAYRYRNDNDKPWHDNMTKCLKWLSDPDLETVKKDLEANIKIQLRQVKDCDGKVLDMIQQSWRPLLDTNGDQVYDDEGIAIGQHLGIVGPDYTIIQDYECIDWLLPWVEADVCTVETGGAIFGGSRFWILVKMKQDPIDVVKDDAVAQYVLIVNGHDGKLAFRAFPTTIRVVCNNTLTLAMASHLAKLFKAKHSRLIHMKIDDIRREVGEMQNILDSNVEKYKALAGTNVQSEKHLQAYFQQVLGEKIDSDKEVNKDSKRPLGTLMRQFECGIGSNMPGVKGTWWAAFNAITEFTTHLRGRNSDARLDNMIVGIGAQLTDKALKLGLDAVAGNLALVA